jgi:hypothetical protein
MYDQKTKNMHIISRRDFLKLSSFIISSLAIDPRYTFSQQNYPGIRVKFGIVTDAHYADSDPRGNRYFRESVSKMEECIEVMNHMNLDFLVELGDFKDQDEPPNKENTLIYLQKIENIFQQFEGPKYHVIGNHDL